jgi:L-fuconolactonase
MVTDAVLHVWKVPLNPQYHERIEPTSAGRLLVEMDQAGVDRAVLVPPQPAENDYGLESAGPHSDRFRVMPVIDPLLPGSGAAFDRLAAHPLVVGARLVLHTQDRARALEAGEYEAFLDQIEASGLPLAMFPPGSLRLVGDVARRHLSLRLVVDHLGLPLTVTGPRVMDELQPALDLARFPNIAIKASGLPTHSELPFPFLDVRQPLEALVQAFGPARVFWGSDLTRLKCSYREAVEMMSFVVTDDRLRGLLMGGSLAAWLGWPETGA